ncbi:ABC transporter substrate-binding protein [Symbioplanes lichenis]|uniref:ABC transporter substrate-binding protein n=1 Tax=Symbioplanes lichenis TaxID=1629072 RepID=UPI002739FBBB|nr:ABC transporter substrate-binding protein [Actinoplanes lichenis]
MKRALLAVLILLAGCGSSGGDDATLDTIVYLTGVGVQGREAYVQVAIDQGWFREAGFDVEIRPGNGTGQNLQLLQGGRADFAAVDVAAALIEYGKGTFTDFRIVSAVHQKTLACLMALDGSGITKPADLKGKRVAYIPGGVVRVLYEPYAELAGADPNGVRWVTMPAQQMAQGLAAGSIDAATQFVVGRPGVEAAAKGRSAVVLPYADILPDLYGNGLAVTRKATEDPERIRRFTAVMLRGLEYAVDHPAEAGATLAKHQSTQPAAVAAKELELMRPYVRPLGSFDQAKVDRGVAVMQSAGAVPAGFDAGQVIAYDLAPKG